MVTNVNMRKRKIWIPILFAVLSIPALTGKENFLYVYFEDPGRGGVWFAHSDDGYNWKTLNQGKAWILPREGGETMRDPFIARGPEGKFHLIYTTGNYRIGHTSSDDLIHWSEHTHIPMFEGREGVLNVWAPEIYYDDEKKKWLIIWSSTIEGVFPETEGQVKNRKNHRIYGAYTEDFENTDEPFVFLDPGYPVIDATLFPEKDRVIMVVKDERDFPLRKFLKIATGPSLTGPWSELSEPFTDSWSEGPSVLKLDEEYLIYYDQYNRPQHMRVASTKDFKIFKDVTDQCTFPEISKHGGFIEITQTEAKRLKTATLPHSAYQKLFNGQNLDGWEIQNNGQFEVVDGLLRVNRGTGWLRSSDTYNDFTLIMEFRFLEKEANSGIFIRTMKESKDDENGWPANGYQVQCMDVTGGKFPLGTLINYGGPESENVHDLDALAEAYRETGKWNRFVIHCEDERLVVTLNGKVITRSEGVQNAPGHIGIQGEHGLLEFRRIDLIRH